MATVINQQSGFRAALGEFAAKLPRLKGQDRVLLVDQLHRLALANDLHSAADMVGGMADAIDREKGSALLGPWLAAIDQAASCGSGQRDVTHLLLATVGVRYAH